MKNIKRNCLYCSNEFLADPREVNRGNAKFCNLKCSHLYRTINIVPKEPNVKCAACEKRFYVTQKRIKNSKSGLFFCTNDCKISEHRINGKIAPKYYGTAGKNVKIFDICCIYCNANVKRKKKHKFCSLKCSVEYRSKIYRLHRNELINYRADCAFKFNVYDFPSEFNLKLIEDHGWYKAKNRGNNLNGVSRDHMISVKYGFDNNIPSSIISHPANCELKLHNENISKGKKCSLNIDELYIKINNWNLKYEKN